MFENLLVVAGIAMLLWLGTYAYYLYTSRQQKLISEEINVLEKMLDSLSENNSDQYEQPTDY